MESSPRRPGSRTPRPGTPGQRPGSGRPSAVEHGPAKRRTDAPRRVTPPAPRGRGNTAAIAGRCAVGLLSTLILTVTCYAWVTLHGLTAGLNTNDVISKGPSAPDGATDILLVGDDSRTDSRGNPLPDNVLKALRTSDDGGSDNTDTMILVRIANGGQRASAVSLPRDTLVNMGSGYGMQKLNSAMANGMAAERQRLVEQGVTDPRQLATQSRAAGQKFLIKTVENLTGAHIDHYAEVNLLGFYQITNAIGGVDVCLKNPVNDHYSGANFRAGPQTVQGSDALAFVRQRHGLPRGDLDRVVRQQVFLSGLARKLLSTGTLSNPEKMSNLVTAVQQSLILDAGWDILGFAQQMQGITGGNIEFNTIPVQLKGPSGEEDVVADVSQVHQFIADLALDPAARQAKQQQEAAGQALRGRTTVTVYNASGVGGLAKTVLSTLTDQGFQQGTSGNADSLQNSSVRFAPGDEAAARMVSDALGGLSLQPTPGITAGTVEIYLGRDYHGPGVTGSGGSSAQSAQNFLAQPAAWARPLNGPQPAQQPSGDDQPNGDGQSNGGGQQITAAGVACVN